MRALAFTLIFASGCIDIGALSAHYTDGSAVVDDMADARDGSIRDLPGVDLAGSPACQVSSTKSATFDPPPTAGEMAPIASLGGTSLWFAVVNGTHGYLWKYDVTAHHPTAFTTFASTTTTNDVVLPRLTNAIGSESDAYLAFMDATTSMPYTSAQPLTTGSGTPSPQTGSCTPSAVSSASLDIARNGNDWLEGLTCSTMLSLDLGGTAQPVPPDSLAEVRIVPDPASSSGTFIIGSGPSGVSVYEMNLAAPTMLTGHQATATPLTGIGASVSPDGTSILIAGLDGGTLATVTYSVSAPSAVVPTLFLPSIATTHAPVGVATGVDRYVVVYELASAGIGGLVVYLGSSPPPPRTFPISTSGHSPQVAATPDGTFVMTYINATTVAVDELTCP